jgi:hypothetical protein
MLTLLQSTEVARSPIQTSRRWSVMPMAAVVVASAGIGFGRPFRSNQNTYLLQAVGPSLSPLRDDWLLHTTDAHPVFTAVAGLASGRVGFAAESFVLMLAAFTGLYLVASTLLRTASRTVRTAVPSLAVLLLSAACYLIPHILVPAQSWAHPFRGFGGQFLMSIPSMFQASDCGTLMLLSSGIAVWATTSRLRRLLWVMAAGLAVSTCALHPTYLAPLAVALLGFAVADLASQRTIRRFGWYTGTGLAAVIVVVATNPVVRVSLTHDPGDPQRYLAFERIPHHTLISHWSVQDAFLAVVVLVGAGLTVRLTRAWWAGIVLTVCLIMAVGTALTVEITRTVTLAMMFPWRITVFLVPVATLTVIVWLLRLIAERVGQVKIQFIVAACLMPVCLGVGTYLTLTAPDPMSERAVHALRAAGPSGVGLIPPELGNVRLNTPAAVYVDWKSHPYAPADLAEWQRRIAMVKLAETDDGMFCRLVQQENIAWVMLRPDRTPPACIVGWRRAGSDDVRIYIG